MKAITLLSVLALAILVGIVSGVQYFLSTDRRTSLEKAGVSTPLMRPTRLPGTIDWSEMGGLGLDGKPLEIARLSGQKVLVYFSCGCVPCQDSDPNAAGLFLATHGRTLFKGIQVVSVVKELRSDALRLKTEGKLPGVILSDPDGRITARLGVRACPYAIAVNRDGHILLRSSLGEPLVSHAWKLASSFPTSPG